MHRLILLGLLVATASCDRQSRQSQEVATGDSIAAGVDSAKAEVTGAAPSAAKPEPAQPAPKPAPKPPPPPPPVTAEEAAAASATIAKVGLAVYPAKGQSKDQTVRDELACSDWAKQQTGIDPMTVAANTDSASAAAKKQADSATEGDAVRGAARGAAGGAVVGAIAGDAGTGAAIGAVAGGARGRKQKKAAENQAGQEGAAQAEAQAAGALDKFGKAMASCLEGKGYTAK